MRGKPWSEDEIAHVRERFADSPTQALADALGRTYGQVAQYAAKIGLHKSQQYLESDAAQRFGFARSPKTMFKPGLVPWNKGLHYQPRNGSTRFKAGEVHGRAAERQKPLGHEHVNDDGILCRKVADTGRRQDRWRAVHVLVWEAVHGPVPPKRIIVFRPGRKTTDPQCITIDALECITRGELMKRNSVHAQYPPELARLVQLRGVLNRQINQRAKEVNHEQEHSGPEGDPV
jgi:hypothetical protein